MGAASLIVMGTSSSQAHVRGPVRAAAAGMAKQAPAHLALLLAPRCIHVCVHVHMLQAGVSMGVFSRAGANWEDGGYGPLLSVPACQPGLLAAICPDQHLGQLKETMLKLTDSSLVSGRAFVRHQAVPWAEECCFPASSRSASLPLHASRLGVGRVCTRVGSRACKPVLRLQASVAPASQCCAQQ
jgi:hypothetical protein